jgi:hypothetical protein
MKYWDVKIVSKVRHIPVKGGGVAWKRYRTVDFEGLGWAWLPQL